MNATLSPTKVRRKVSSRRPRAGSLAPPYTQETHDAALYAIRNYLKGRTSYDSFPVSFRLIVLDSKLEVRKALTCLLSNGVVSAPLWNSEKSCFAGMFTVSDIIHLIQYYHLVSTSYHSAEQDVENFRLESLRDIEKTLGVAQPPLLRENPSSSLYDASKLLIQTHARRVPLLDHDTETGHEVIVSILTQYRLLKFISINCPKDIQQLHLSLHKLNIGTYVSDSTTSIDDAPEGYNRFHPIATATMSTLVVDVVQMFSQRGISAVPIINEDGIVVNLYETVDVIALVRNGQYQSLDLTIAEALNLRQPDFPGVVICTASDSLGTLMQLIKKRRVHRLVVVEGDKGRLLGIITLSDVLRYLIGERAIGETPEQRSGRASVSERWPSQDGVRPPSDVSENPPALDEQPQPPAEPAESTPPTVEETPAEERPSSDAAADAGESSEAAPPGSAEGP
ncbi:CBS-domain-containing protein [Daedalea quercina L-15889]|uniref:CBS-domain-containing protein n=1 Tax=Daedalea quercina L-15889 TaxID=1314783 RepID=A0A165UBL0_9APHY|nr:CBS-domain-containing protein [Daedalea quercina L-15889]